MIQGGFPIPGFLSVRERAGIPVCGIEIPGEKRQAPVVTGGIQPIVKGDFRLGAAVIIRPHIDPYLIPVVAEGDTSDADLGPRIGLRSQQQAARENSCCE